MFDLFVHTYQAWREPRQSPTELHRLTDVQLRELGLTRNDATAAGRKQVVVR